MTPDISTTNSEMRPSVHNTKTMNTPNLDDFRIQTIPYNLLQESTSDFQLPRNISLHPKNTDLNINATCIKVNQSPRENITPTLTTFEQTKQIIMDIDAISHSNTLCNIILKSLKLNGLFKYKCLHKAYIFEHSKHQSIVPTS